MNNNFSDMNFFYSANSEAYQDAFLTWIFYNFPKEETKKLNKNELQIELENFSEFMLKKMMKLENDEEEIEEVYPKTQVKNSDIILKIKTNKNDYLIVIEDKVGSSIHPSVKSKKKGKIEFYPTQLEKYYDKFLEIEEFRKYFNDGRVYLFYYKNEYVNEYEIRVIEGANNRCKELLKNQYDKEINEKENKKYKKQKYIVDNQRELEELKNQRKIIHNNYNNCFRKWEILDINWIYDLFCEFEKQIGTINNYILIEYFQSIDFWHKQFKRIESMNLYNKNDPDFLWEAQSKIWNPIFVKLMKSIRGDASEDRFVITTYNGKYWQIALTSKNNRTCILLDVNHISEESVTININLRNRKYGDQDLPWGDNDSNREKDRKKISVIFGELAKKDNAWKANIREKNDSNDINLLAGYTAKTDNNEKISLQFLIDTWKKVEEDLKDIEYTDFENKTVKVFEK